MPVADLFLMIFVGAILAGLAGALLGIGGGVFMVPYLTLVLGVDIHVAISASIIGVIATSSGAASAYVRDRVTNMRLGMFLEVATTIGAIIGSYVALLLAPQLLQIVFGAILPLAAYLMLRQREDTAKGTVRGREKPTRPNLAGSYFDEREDREIAYEPQKPAAGFGVSLGAGVASGLLGVGGGFIKVPAMNLLMKVPMKVAVATSNFMIGVTAAASAMVYFQRGSVDLTVTAAVILGVIVGSMAGVRYMQRVKGRTLKRVFTVLLLAIAALMILKGLGGSVIP
jgi:uncharacterized membrane protein YfcA